MYYNDIYGIIVRSLILSIGELPFHQNKTNFYKEGAMEISTIIPGLGFIPSDSGFMPLQKSSDNIFAVGELGVVSILATGDRKVEFITFESSTLALVNSSMGYPAYYPVHPVNIQKPIRGVLMDLDGTTVHSEEFWMLIIQMSIASLLGDSNFR